MPAKAAPKTVAKVAPKKATAAAVGAGRKVVAKKSRKIRTRVQFRRPFTRLHKRDPKFLRRPVKPLKQMDQFGVVRYPLTTASAMKKIEDHDTIVFIVDNRANKSQIKSAVKKLYDIHVKRVNTLIRPDGLKKALVKLRPTQDALEIANKIGIL
eukprot:TRINITY_DN971_c0_g2_i1.p3 TRINITY_DN971_c0_g2~~TRINITY_DN971_c0_g2_i1.p3  ORF type:complete len:154 (+),score=51.13 TRINITY_DN971_c0_g2_i1:56-517(+)